MKKPKRIGDDCSDCEKGKLYETSTPGVLVRIIGKPPLQANIYDLEKLKCGLESPC